METADKSDQGAQRLYTTPAFEEIDRCRVCGNTELESILNLGHMPQTRHVAGRLFKEIDGVWTDLGHDDTQQVVRIAAFSDAYFALLAALPELEPYVKDFQILLVAGRYHLTGERLPPVRHETISAGPAPYFPT